VEYLQTIFSLSGIDVLITEPLAVQSVFASDKNTPPREADETIHFGKYKGQKWGETPTEYLKWVKASMPGYNADIAQKILWFRKEQERGQKE
jgi:hypothetical protein